MGESIYELKERIKQLEGNMMRDMMRASEAKRETTDMRLKALQLAEKHLASPDETVLRASRYLAFMRGELDDAAFLKDG